MVLVSLSQDDMDLKDADGPTSPLARDVNGTDNFRSESASASVFKDMVCTCTNPADTDADTDYGKPDIRRIW